MEWLLRKILFLSAWSAKHNSHKNSQYLYRLLAFLCEIVCFDLLSFAVNGQHTKRGAGCVCYK